MAAEGDAGPIGVGERIGIIDVVRGFALFGILVVNMAAFKGVVFGDVGEVVAGPADRVASWVIAAGFETKFYVLFSLLFGYGLSVQMTRAAAKGAPLVGRYLRRLLGLLLIGLAHALLLYTGDILVTYALLGVVLLALRNVSSRVLLRLAAGLVATSVLLFLAGAAVLSAAGEESAAIADTEPDAERALEAFRGTPTEVIAQRVREYPGTLAFALLGQGPPALAMFFLGLAAGRRRLFERAEEQRALLRRVLAVGLAVGVPGALVWGTYRARYGFGFTPGFLYAGAADFATAPFLSAVYVSTLVLLSSRPAWRRRLALLAPVGRMALSNYLLQSLVGALVFTGYGLALFGRVGSAAGLALSVAVFAAQIPLSAWWLRRFSFGPAEWLLRSFTYGALQPLRLPPAAAPRQAAPLAP